MNINKLEKWYLKNHRKLPFRESKDPYKIWVSEIMLQQTQVETVLPFFERFIFKYPDVTTLANANEEVLHKDVEGLGYYRRFRNMHLSAKLIVEKCSGIFPITYQQIISLPGIGKYTAGAIMSIAYDKPYSALDGNVVRVLSRYLGIDSDMRLEKNKKQLDQINQENINQSHPAIYTQAMMELGALVCRPKNPSCEMCPLNDYCFAFENQLMSSLPMISKLKKQQIISYITLIIHTKNGYLLNKRKESLLYGMYEYPQFESESIYTVLNELQELNIELELIDHNPQVYKHNFTHQIWIMNVYQVRLIRGKHPKWIEVSKQKLSEVPMAIAHRKI